MLAALGFVFCGRRLHFSTYNWLTAYGNCQFEYEYYMIDDQNKYHKLSSEDSECDLGVLFKSNLKFDNTLTTLLTRLTA